MTNTDATAAAATEAHALGRHANSNQFLAFCPVCQAEAAARPLARTTANYLPTRRESDAIKAILAQELEDQGAESNTSGLFIHEIEEAIADFYVGLWYDIDYAEALDLAERIAGSFDGIDV